MATWKAPFLKGRISPVLFLVPSGKTHIFICTQMYTQFTKQSLCYKVQNKSACSTSHILDNLYFIYPHLYLYLKAICNFPGCNLYRQVFVLIICNIIHHFLSSSKAGQKLCTICDCTYNSSMVFYI